MSMMLWTVLCSKGYDCVWCVVKPVVPRCSVPVAVTVGKSSELRCLENEGFPAPQYSWFHNNEELPLDPKNSIKFINSSYSINSDTGGLVSYGQRVRTMLLDDMRTYCCVFFTLLFDFTFSPNPLLEVDVRGYI